MFFFSSRRRHTRFDCDWSSDVCSSDLLRNITSTNVPLFDPAAVTNTWKIGGGVDFAFPQNVTLPAGGYLLVVNFDPAGNPTRPAAFCNKYSVAPCVPLFGPYRGHLCNTQVT